MPDAANPKNVSDLFARVELIEGLRLYGSINPGLFDDTLLKAIDDDESALYDQVADAIKQDSTSKGMAIPETVARSFKDGSTGLYSFDPNGAPGKKLVEVKPVLDAEILLTTPVVPAQPPDTPPAPAP